MNNKGKHLHLKELDAKLWTKFKVKCMNSGITLQAKVVELIKEFVKR